MTPKVWVRAALCAVFAVMVFAVVGCGESSGTGKPLMAKREKAHEHGEWWCDEHGVPEDVCAQCHAKLVAGFKEKKDWCDKHNRPDSQCFICHPEKKAEWAKMYEDKYGKKPPEPKAD